VFSSDRDPPLSRPWWSWGPRAATLWRGLVIAALLATAAAVLYAEDGPTGPCPAAHPTPAGGSPTLPTGTVGLPIRLAEPAALSVLRPGDRVDLLALPGHTADSDHIGEVDARPPASPVTIATAALVLAVSEAADSALYLAVPPAAARQASGMPEGTRFSVIVRPG